MDGLTLAPLVMPYLIRYLPQLIVAGKFVGGKALEKIVENSTDGAWKFAKPWLGKLMGRIEESPAALPLAEKVALTPDNQKYQTALEVQLEDILSANPALAEEIAQLIGQAERENITVRQGDRSVFVKGDNTGVIMTGDVKR
jgi:hypothetical protein